jgi:3-phenylpropionate/cinnamic acid dioxygenase small subunit
MNAPAKPAAAALDREAAEAFLIEEARLLDEGRWREWQALFTADMRYWVPSNRRDADPLQHVSFVFDDAELLDERLRRLESNACYAQQPPSATLHQIGNVAVAPGDADGEVRIRSNQVIYEIKQNSQRRLEPLNVFPAFCEHVLRREGDAWKIRYKKVGLLNCDAEITNLTFLV